MKESVQVSSFMTSYSLIVVSTRMKMTIQIGAYLTVVHADDEHHQPNLGGWAILDLNAHPIEHEHQAIGNAIPDLNVRPTYDNHQAEGEATPDLNLQPADFEEQADGDIAFDITDEQDDFDLDLLVHAQREEMQQSMISNLQ